MLTNRKRILGWVAGGQALTALGTVGGLRILTQYLDPAMFGLVTLALGVAALGLGLFCTPLTQAAMYFYPSLTAQGEEASLPGALRRGLVHALPWLLAGGAIVAIDRARTAGGAISAISRRDRA